MLLVSTNPRWDLCSLHGDNLSAPCGSEGLEQGLLRARLEPGFWRVGVPAGERALGVQASKRQQEVGTRKRGHRQQEGGQAMQSDGVTGWLGRGGGCVNY